MPNNFTLFFSFFLKRLPKGDNVSVGHDANLAFQKAARIFIMYLTYCSTDFCKQHHRSTISSNDVFDALNELEFDEFTEPLINCLQHFRKNRQANKEEKKKRDAVKEENVPAATSLLPNSLVRDPVLPQATIKKIMKKDKDVSNMSKEALFIMTKCTDLFVEFLGEASIRQAYGKKRKSVCVDDINAAIHATSFARFLEPDFQIPTLHKRQKIMGLQAAASCAIDSAVDVNRMEFSDVNDLQKRMQIYCR